MELTKMQLLNISTGILHTDVGDIYKFFNEVVEEGIMTHHLPRALIAIAPFVRNRFPGLPTEGYHPDYEGGKEIVEFALTAEENILFWESFKGQPDPLIGKEVIAVTA